MRERRDPGGRMPCRLWYDEREIDTIMEDELRRSGTARIGRAAVDVDAFIENYLRITPEYVALPQGRGHRRPLRQPLHLCSDPARCTGGTT